MRVPRTTYPWPRTYTLRNYRAIIRARLDGATVSLNQVQLEMSKIERNALILDHALLRKSSVGRYTIIGPNSSLFLADIGPFSGLAERTTVGAMPHWPTLPTSHAFPINPCYGITPEYAVPELVRTSVGADAWLGTGAVVRAGVRVGHGAVVGAGAVVTRDVADYEIVAGVPAQRLRMRFEDDVVKRLLRLRWWDWSPQLLQQHVALFRRPMTVELLEQLEEAGSEAEQLEDPSSEGRAAHSIP